MPLLLTQDDLDALESVTDRAEDDWLMYRNSGHGPRDFDSPGEWREHKIREDSNFKRVRRLILRAARELKAGPLPQLTVTCKGENDD